MTGAIAAAGFTGAGLPEGTFAALGFAAADFAPADFTDGLAPEDFAAGLSEAGLAFDLAARAVAFDAALSGGCLACGRAAFAGAAALWLAFAPVAFKGFLATLVGFFEGMDHLRLFLKARDYTDAKRPVQGAGPTYFISLTP